MISGLGAMENKMKTTLMSSSWDCYEIWGSSQNLG